MLDVDTKVIAGIIAKLKKASGIEIDEERLSIVLQNSLNEIKKDNPNEYIKTINEISEKLEQMAIEIGKLSQKRP
jgi:hypothetical protein